MSGSGVMMLGFHKLLSSDQYIINEEELKGLLWDVDREVESFLLSVALSLSKPVSIIMVSMSNQNTLQ